MRPVRLWLVLVVALVIAAGSYRPLSAAGPTRSDDFREQLLSFDEVLEQVRLAAADDQWRQKGWKSPIIERWLDQLMSEVKQATKRESLKLPVKFSEVKPAEAGNANPLGTSALHVVQDGKIPFVRNSIVLADGSVDISSAEHCLIIARCGVRISSSRKCVVLAGYCIDLSFDSMAGNPNDEASDGSLLMSRSIVRVSHARGTICSAPDLVEISNANNVVFLNSPTQKVSHTESATQLKAELTSFRGRAAKNPLAEKIKITQVIPSEGGGLVVHERGGVEFVVRPGTAAHDETGKPLPGMENWKLSFLARDLAVFSNGRHDAAFFIKR